MTVNYEYDGVTASQELEAYVNGKLEKLFNKYEFVVRADVFFKTENTSDRNSKMKTSIRLSAPGPRLFAENATDSFHKSSAEVINALERQLDKRKDAMQTH
ncbi:MULTISPECIES: ribosome hibernation-promoting factor, HPF/YfiA family [unclassified Lacinutrix]|uniref:ribosome hibernation-promoting factor, HPF/YfiA family n=1 Tax=unclassified Lacinutrix TaxID=2647285 RepID=UPI00020A33F7|nr:MULTISPECIES: ribosome-associated translation inhibitor RaiA [unclassified Lacinutrix]AEH02365.1 ribosomal subunit interface protein [Lacinutrix sp. 5H-3-7-4]OIQ23823.1 MAG: ribosomal subunit interface protein [Lacinutrix sp. MedPE-SW]